MTWDEIRNMQVEDIMRWPLKLKAIAAAILILLLGAAAWFWFISPENSRYKQLHSQVQNLKTEVRQKQLLAAGLPAYQKQIRQMNVRFEHFLAQLPNRRQIPSLLDGVTLAGRSRGLEFELFQPLPEVNRNFYAKIPVTLKVVGTYDEIGQFAAAVAAMPRIVTISGLNITRVRSSATSPLAKAHSFQHLAMQCRATTYRYIGIAQQPKKGSVR